MLLMCLFSVSHLCLYDCVCVCVRASAPCGPLLRSSYKDCNTLHLPMERFSPVRRFSDGATSIQAFKAHLENSSLIKQLKQVHGCLNIKGKYEQSSCINSCFVEDKFCDSLHKSPEEKLPFHSY